MKRKLLQTTGLLSCAVLVCGSAVGQIAFTNKNTLLHSSTGVAGSNANKRSGNSVTVVDMDNNGFDDICQLQSNGAVTIEYQQAGGSFTFQSIGTFGASGSWAMCAGDIDKNGYKDVISGYGSSLKVMKINAGGIMGSVTTLQSSNFFVQNLNFMDIDGDTWLDIFACDDNAHGKIYRNDGAGNLYLLGHSTTSLTIGTGAQNLTVQTNLTQFTNGSTVKVGYDGSNYMTGTVTSYNSGTGALVVNITSVVGSGTHATWSVDPSVVLNTQISTLTVGSDPYDSGNYGTVWTDFDNDGDVDLYIAKCRQAASSPTDPRRRDVLFENMGNGNYKDNGATYNLGSMDQDWTPSFGDVDNDGDFDLFLTKHNTNPNLYINNGSGSYTASSAYSFGNMPMQSQFEDFDNDGFIDMLMTGDNAEKIYHNNGNGTFTDVTPSNLLVSGNNLLSFATGDLNHDGKIDIYGSYGTTYNNSSSSVDDIFWQNSTNNTNHFLTLNVVASISNNDALGARAYIYGAWGVQTREVRAGESYGTRNSSQLHFGLGSATAIDSVVVNWPSGVRTVIANPSADQFLNVIESNPCTLSGATVSASGPLTICSSGPGVTLTANASGTGSGYTYLWTNGATTQAITVNTPGNYAVTITESTQCHSTSTDISVVVDPDETPSIAAAADTVFCQGDSVLLTSSSATAYMWSNGATTQSTYVSASGSYSVQTQGLCQQWTSNVISVNVHPAPAPTGTDVTLTAPSTTTVTATGNSIVWYQNPTGGTPLASGPSYNTGMITMDTVFYAEDSYSYGGAIANGAPTNHPGGTGGALFSGNTTNAYEIFTANETCTLQTVKVYTDLAGVRTIELRSSTGTVLKDTTLNIPLDTTVITLNFPLTAGTSYQIGCNQAQNNTSFGYNAPRLRRTNNASVVYPYRIISGIDTLVTITAASQNGTLFYYFYDWHIAKAPAVCTSTRTPVHVYLNPVGLARISNDNAIRIYPNPASDHITVSLQSPKNAEATVMIYDMLGKQLHNETYNASADKNISTQGMKAGVYEMTVTTDGKVYHTRFVVQ